MAKAERAGAEDVAARGRGGCVGLLGEGADELVEGLGRAPILLLLIGRHFECHDRDAEPHGAGEAARVILDQLGGAGRADQQGVGTEPLDGVAGGVLEQGRRVGAEIAGLERRVAHRRTPDAALDHRKQQVGVGVALRRMQHQVHALHRGGDSHRPHMRRPLVGPKGELHG